MKLINLSQSYLTMGWIPANFPARLKQQSAGLSAVFFLKGVFRLKPDGVPEPWEEGPVFCAGDLPIDDDPELGLGYASDFVPFKPVADFTAVGTAYPPKRADAHFPVRMRVGDRQQEIKVFGPWKWERSGLGLTEKPGSSGPPIPVPITYANAWGGPDYPLNPLGCGRVGEKTHLLEFPNAYITHRDFISGPAVFAPMPPDAPLRNSKLGTYDKEWIKERWPWLPVDFDYSFFNAAHPDQWMEGYLRGDEPLRFENMHPKHAVYESRLPGLRARCFVSQTTNWKVGLKSEEAQSRFHEVPMALDTLWVDMEKEKLVLIWRGSIPVRSFKFRDIENLMILTESLEERPAKGLDHYEALMKTALYGDLTEADSEVVPEISDDWKETFEKLGKQMDDAETKILHELQQAKNFVPNFEKDFESMATKNPETAPLIKEALSKAKEATPESVTSAEESVKRMLELVKSNPNLDQATVTAMTADILEYGRSEKFFEFVEKEFKELSKMLSSSSPDAKTGANFMVTPIPGEAPSETPSASVDIKKLRSEGVSGLRLKEMDFSGLDLSGLDFSYAVLSKCRFRDAKLIGADLTGADLGESDLTGADFSKAVLDFADLRGCEVNESIWRGASVTRTKFDKLNLKECDFSGVKGAGAEFTGADITGALFVGAEISHSSFNKAVAEWSDFTGAILEGADFEEAKAAGIRMEGADLTGFRGGAGADFTGGCFRRAKAADSFWERSDLTQADFRQASLPGAQFTESILTDTNLDRCDLREADFQDALMQRAILTHSNMLRCSFDRADMTGALMDRSNLYETGFWDATLLGASWKDANVKLTALDHA